MFVEDYISADYYDALPPFSSNVFDFLYSYEIGITKESIIADIGSGTGRLSYDFLKRGNKVYSIDPDANMRAICDSKCYKFNDRYVSVEGTETNMNINSKSVDFVVASQVYHRFDAKLFKKECERVLKNPKNVIIIWYRIDFNYPVYSEMLQCLKYRYSEYKTRYLVDEINGALLEEEENNTSVEFLFNKKSKLKNILSLAFLNKKEFIKLGLSLSLFPITHEMNTVSKVLESNSFDKEGYIKDLETIYNKFAKNKKIKLIFKVQIHSFS